MTVMEVVLAIGVYLLPMLFFFYMGVDVLRRNPNKTAHRLVSLTIACYFLLFLEEWIRYMLPIAYSPVLTRYWFSNVGIAIPGLGLHFLVKFTHLDKRMPRFLYPYLFYAPLLVIPLNTFGGHTYASAQSFAAVGFWKLPLYDATYYITLSSSIFVSLTSFAILYIGMRRLENQEDRAIYRLLTAGIIATIGWVALFGYGRLGDWLPPYPYLYAGLLWCFLLTLAMKKYDFLHFNHQRYEKLFHMNPAAILLVDLSGTVKEANPAARQLFSSLPIEKAGLDALGADELIARLIGRQPIKELEMRITDGNRQLEVLIDGDYVRVDDEPHAVLIIRNITLQKEHQRQIAFLAYHDALTGLPNRRYFYDKLDETIREADSLNRQLAVIVIDLDEFKETNDRYGHVAGDELLKHTARVLSDTVGSLGMAARLGGDEFVLFLPAVASEAEVNELLGRLEENLTRTELRHGNDRLTVGMSIGVSYYPQDGHNLDMLLNHADKAMYKTKRTRKTAL